MTWNEEQAANDLERYLLRKEPPAIGAVELAIVTLRYIAVGCEGCYWENGYSDGYPCEECSRSYADLYERGDAAGGASLERKLASLISSREVKPTVCGMRDAVCTRCGAPDPSSGDARYCATCGARIVYRR